MNPFLVICQWCSRTIVLVIPDRGLDAQHAKISPRVDAYLRLKGRVKESTYPCADCVKEFR